MAQTEANYMKNLSGAQGKKHNRRCTMWLKAPSKLVNALRKKEKRKETTYEVWLYTANWGPKSMKKNNKKTRKVANIRYYRMHMQICRPEQPEIKDWFCAVNLITCLMKISSETRSKISCWKKIQTSIKENNLRKQRESKHSPWGKKKNRLNEGNKILFFSPSLQMTP